MSTTEPDSQSSSGGVQRDPADALLWGTPYRTVKRLGGGGEAEMVVAERVSDGARVQVKIPRLPGSDGDASTEQRRLLGDRTRLEGELLKKLRHPNAVKVLDVGQSPDGRPYFVTELLDGARSLGEILAERGALPVPEALWIALSVLGALEAAHALGAVHRDVKPQNILVIEEDRRVLLTDFGIAKVLAEKPGGPAALAQPTALGTLLGSPRYLSPEMVLGRAVDARSDVYQMGVVLFEMVTGRGPFDELHGEALVVAHATRPAPAASSMTKAPLPKGLDGAIARAIAKRPEDRFAGAAALAAALQRTAQNELGVAEAEELRQLGVGRTEVLTVDTLVSQLADLGLAHDGLDRRATGGAGVKAVSKEPSPSLRDAPDRPSADQSAPRTRVAPTAPSPPGAEDLATRERSGQRAGLPSTWVIVVAFVIVFAAGILAARLWP